MSDVNRCWRLAARPQGMIKDSDFTLSQEAVPEIKDGEILVRNLYLSVDPTQRGWLERDTYMPAVAIGEVVRAIGAGKVVASKNPGYAVGDVVTALVGWQDYAVLGDGGALRLNKVPAGVPVPTALSAFGLTGLTAYFGLLDVGQPKEGETVVVSGAAGATGMMAGQIAKAKGCRVIGIAGGPEKCAWITGELGFDAAIDYKSEKIPERLRELCPNGINVFFDNVGGEILDAVLAQLALRARVVLCGGISDYNNMAQPTGPKNYMALVMRRAKMEGFLVSDYAARFPEAIQQLAAWFTAGKIKDRVDILEGIENAPAALRRLFTGANIGKQLVKIADA